MVKVQEWLDQNYPKENRSEVKEIHLNESSLEGEIDLGDFTYEWWGLAGQGLKVFISPQVNETKLTFKNKPEGTWIILENRDAQKNIDYNYPTLEEKRMVTGLCTNRLFSNPTNSSALKGSLDLSDFVNLTHLELIFNELTFLNLYNCSRLESIHCSNNQLSNIVLPKDVSNLRELSLISNNFRQDLSFLQEAVNLEILDLGNDFSAKFSQGIYNKFTGSLEPLKKMEKLWKLDINDTDISHGLEYLPKSITSFNCSFTRVPQARVSDIWDELQPFVKDNKNWKDFNEGEDFAEKLRNWREAKIDKQLSLVVSPLIPPQLLGEMKQKSRFAMVAKLALKQEKEKQFLANIQDFKYDKIHLNQWGESNFPAPKSLPTRLYNIETGKVEESHNRADIKYASLSYIWGDSKNTNNKLIERERDELNEVFSDIGYDNINQMTRLGYKSWKKAVETCRHLDINYLWVDQLCINQNSTEDKGNEVSKMRQYYGNAEATLTAIDERVGDLNDIDLVDNVLSKIVNSEWFTRSWTFQEGWLSKHTIFMFDDKLIDGWAMAGTWSLNQLGYVGEGRYNSRREFDKGSKKIATPVGWVYYRDGYNENDKVTMTLTQALKEIKHRGRGIPVDGVYSILGLLPYGDKVKVNYKGNLCKECKEKEKGENHAVDCVHPEEKRTEWPTYFQEDLQKALIEVMKVANENEFAEPIAWHGSGVNWLPQIDEKGSTSIRGGITIKGKLYSQEKGIELETINYLIQKADNAIHKRESGFEIEGGLYERKVWVKTMLNKEAEESLKVELGKYPEDQERLKMVATEERLGEEEIRAIIQELKSEKTKKMNLDFLSEGGDISRLKSSLKFLLVTTELTLLGTKETMELIKENTVLAIPSKYACQSFKPFALLLEDSGEDVEGVPICYRLGLVELGIGGERLAEEDTQGLGKINVIISNQNQFQQVAQILQTELFGSKLEKSVNFSF